MRTQNGKCETCGGIGKITCSRCKGKGIEPRSKYHSIPINWTDKVNWADIYEHSHKFEGKSWIFRGQTDAYWPLETTLERHCKYFRNDMATPNLAEESLCREFRRRYHQYSQDIPRSDNDLEWFSIMQHYGAPTRLLDFTYSMSIALYFALEYTYTLFERNKKDVKCAVWAINAKWAQERSQIIIGKTRGHGFLKKVLTDKTEMMFEDVFMREQPKSFACPLNPFRVTERLTIQKGIFMCPGDVNKPFEINLRSMKGYDKKENIIKFEILLGRDNWRDAMDRLYNQNIYRASLFPDLEGFAKSLQVSPPKRLI